MRFGRHAGGAQVPGRQPCCSIRLSAWLPMRPGAALFKEALVHEARLAREAGRLTLTAMRVTTVTTTPVTST